LPQHLKAGKGAKSFSMHPKIVIRDTARVGMIGAERLAVHQLSANHWDDQRNVDLRQFSKDFNPDFDDRTRRKAEWLFDKFVKDYFKTDGYVKPRQCNTADWLETRSKQFLAMLTRPQLFGELGRSTQHQAFLKTQDKVKAKPNFTAELQYGQTVIASDPSYNAYFGPHARGIEKSIQSLLRDDYLIDVGYSDRDLARLLRERNLFPLLCGDDPCQIDVSRQDSSHSAVTVIVFALLLEYLGMPSDMCDLYVHKRSAYKVRSMASCLYSGVLSFTLPSGDPFTLICNIIHMMTVMSERYNMAGRCGITKGDDTQLDRKPDRRLGYVIDECRAVKLEIVTNGVAYHAGRFLIPNGNLCYDPVRLVLKVLAKGEGAATNEELCVALQDRMIWLDGYAWRYLAQAIPRQYTGLDTQLCYTILRICSGLKDGNLYWQLVKKQIGVERKIRFSSDSNCAIELAQFLKIECGVLNEFEFVTQNEAASLFRKYTNHNVFTTDGPIPRKAWLLGGVVVQREHVLFIM